MSTLFYRNAHLLALSLILTLVAGFSALESLPRLEDPVITNRNPLVLTPFPGASADRVEAQVTEPIERSLQEIQQIKEIKSTSRAGLSLVSIELVDATTEETNDAVFSEIRDRIDDASRAFPPGAGSPFLDDKRNAVAYTLILGIRWHDGAESRLGILSRQAEELADRLRGVPGTEVVRIFGNPSEEIVVSIDPVDLASLGLTTEAFRAILRQADARVPAGTIHTPSRDYLLEVEGALDSLDRVGEVLLVRTGDGSGVRVGDIATVSREVADPPDSAGYHNGIRSVFVAARVQEDRQVDQWSEAALETVARFQEEAGGLIETEIVFQQSTYTDERLGSLSETLGLGALVVSLVVLLTMGWRSSLIISCALPLTASLTLFVVALTGGKLHQMSIFGMIIALGILIDNAIVTTDEIRKRLAEGIPREDAVRGAVRHLFVPLLSSTVTTILAFLPILLLPGGAGDFVSSIASSVVIALSCSLAVSLLLISALAGRFGTAGGIDARLPAWLRDGIRSRRLTALGRSSVRWALRHPLLGMLVAAAIPVAGFALAPTLGSQFFPRTDRNMFEVEVWMPTGTSLDETRSVAQRMEEILREDAAVESVDWMIGSSFPRVYYNLIFNMDRSPHYAHGIVTAKDPAAVRESIPGLQRRIDRELPEAQTVVSKFAQGPPAQADVEIKLLGPSIATLQDLGEQVRRVLAEHPGILQTQVTLPRGEPKVWFDASEAEAGRSGLPLTGLAAELLGRLDGLDAGVVLESVEQLPVRIRFAGEDRDSLEDARSIAFRDPDNPAAWIPLTALGRLELRPEQGSISREDATRVNRIYGYASSGTLPIRVTSEVLATLEAEGFALPPGYRMEIGGESENRAEAVGNLLLYLPLLAVATLATLVLTFRSVRLAGVLLLVAALSAGYGLFATWAWGFPRSFNTIIGCLGLIGLAFNSSIIVLAAIRADRQAARGEIEAMVRAILGTSRHLLSTTLTTIGSFLPLLLIVGGEFWPPLAIVLAGGVGGSTLLALLFTPAAYRLLSRTDPATGPEPRPSAGASREVPDTALLSA